MTLLNEGVGKDTDLGDMNNLLLTILDLLSNYLERLEWNEERIRNRMKENQNFLSGWL